MAEHPLHQSTIDAARIGLGVFYTKRMKRVRLPWWRAILRGRRYEMRPMSIFEALVERQKVPDGVKWREIELPSLTSEIPNGLTADMLREDA